MKKVLVLAAVVLVGCQSNDFTLPQSAIADNSKLVTVVENPQTQVSIFELYPAPTQPAEGYPSFFTYINKLTNK